VNRVRASSIGAQQQGGGYDESAHLINEQQRDQLDMMDSQIDYSSSVIQERETAIKDIESTMIEVNEIYKDLSTLVVAQGDQLDSIESNMNNVDENVESGVVQLTKASRYQRKARNKMCCLLLILAIILGIILAAYFGSKDKNSSGSSGSSSTSSTASPSVTTTGSVVYL